MDRRADLDDQPETPAGTEPRRGPAGQPPWVKIVAVGVIALFVLATVASALLS